MREKNLGVVYLAFGKPYLAMALYSIATLRKNNQDLPVCIITNEEFDIEHINILHKDKDHVIFMNKTTDQNRDIKTKINEYSPYENTIFIDCDTIIVGDLSDALHILRYFDLAFRLNKYPQKRKGKGDINILHNIPVGNLPHWNSGVILFRKSELSDKFFLEWNKAFNRIGSRYDQVSLVETIFTNDARVLSLDDKWNSIDPIINRDKWKKSVKIFHYGTNISDKMISDIVKQVKNIFPASDIKAIKRAVISKRKLKKSQGLLKYVIARILWKFWTPF
jgi:hypothetical protein